LGKWGTKCRIPDSKGWEKVDGLMTGDNYKLSIVAKMNITVLSMIPVVSDFLI